MRRARLLAVLLAGLAAPALAARLEPEAQLLLAPPRRAGGAALSGDACEGLAQAACDASAACTWCQSAAVPSSCYTLDQAKRLPAAVFKCDTKPSAAPEPALAADFRDGDDPGVRAHWALLVAGSSGWGNYRHQADVYHAYQVLVSGGYKREHIVVMAADDIAAHPENPAPGKVFNAPGGPDVYGGVAIDYRGADVTAETFVSVLVGDAAGVANKGSGRVLASGPADRVFVFYSDHGAAGVVGMPSGPFLYADQLLGAVRRKLHAGGFKELVMYIEACESGSMFEGLLDDNLAAYVTTAANAVDVAWMEDAEASDLTSETLAAQYARIKARTSQNFTYDQGSHVMQYGDLDIDAEVAGDYQGMAHNGTRPPAPPTAAAADADAWWAGGAANGGGGGGGGGGTGAEARHRAARRHAARAAQRDADLLPLAGAAAHAACPRRRAAAAAALTRETAARRRVEAAARAAVAGLVRHADVGHVLLANLGWAPAAVLPDAHPAALRDAFGGAAAAAPRDGGAAPAGANSLGDVAARYVEALLGPLPGRDGAPLVDSWDCLRGMVQAWEGRCGPLGQYGMKHTRLFANLCNAGLRPDALGGALRDGPCAAAA
ncbi:Vacuolar-processing enzyme [Scenedesmus sp. PABB004]|nr:Vacuolar-processing enzyme [Scenedesmus sp. PABB004]